MVKAVEVAAVGALIIVGTGAIVLRKQIAAAITNVITPLLPGQSANPPPGGTFIPGPGTTTPPPSNLPGPGSGGPISAVVTADKTQGPAPLVVKFSPNVSGGTLPIQYRWAFGDGGTSTDPNPVYTFTQAGAYTVALSIVDAVGQSFTDFISISTNNLPPPPAPGPTQPITKVVSSTLTGQAPLSVGFSISVLDPTSSILWDFGDKYASAVNPNTDTSQVVNHSYFTPGNYTVKVTVTSGKWGTQTKTFNVAVSAAPVTGITTNLFLSETQGPAPLYVAFSMSLNVVNQSIVWDFGDGSGDNKNLLAVGHTYQNPGTYNGSVKIVSVDGQTVTKNFSVTVGANPLKTITAGMIVEPGPTGLVNIGIPITVGGTAGGGMPPFISYSWDFGDGGTGSGIQVQHTYQKAGTFAITLTVTDSAGTVGTAQKVVTVTPAPVAIGDVGISLTSIQPFGSSGGSIASIQVKLTNKRTDIPIQGFLAVSIFDNQTNQEVGVEQDSSNLTLQPGTSTSISMLSVAYAPGGKLLVIRFLDLLVTSKAIAEIDLAV